jgi:hypothetical protein
MARILLLQECGRLFILLLQECGRLFILLLQECGRLFWESPSSTRIFNGL